MYVYIDYLSLRLTKTLSEPSSESVDDIYIYLEIYIYLYTYIHIYIYIIKIGSFTFTFTYIYVCMYVCMYILFKYEAHRDAKRAVVGVS